MKELTVQEYMDLVRSEGLLFKSGNDEVMTYDTLEDPKDEELEDEEEEELEDEEEEEDEDETSFELTICTKDLDRIKDILNPMGMETKSFARNPLFLYEHGKGPNGMLSNYDSILGRIQSVTLHEDKVTANALYLPTNATAERVLTLERKGLIPGNSMGWRPLANIHLDNEGNRHVGKWELIEVSKVIVPTNGRATNLRVAA